MAWSRVQGFSQSAEMTTSAIAGTTASAFSIAVSVNDVLLVMTTVGADNTAITSSLSDQLGNIYTRLGIGRFNSPDTQASDWWYCLVTHAGTPVIVYKGNISSGEPWQAIQGSHFQGSVASTVVNVSGSNIQSGPGTAANAISASITPTVDGCLIWVGGQDTKGLGDMVVGTVPAYTAGAGDPGATGLQDEWLVQSSQAAIKGTFTAATNGATGVYTAGMFAITPAAGVVVTNVNNIVAGQRIVCGGYMKCL